MTSEESYYWRREYYRLQGRRNWVRAMLLLAVSLGAVLAVLGYLAEAVHA